MDVDYIQSSGRAKQTTQQQTNSDVEMSNQDDFQPPYLRSAAGSGDYEETKTNPHGFFHDTKSAAACSVRVALRVRPLVARELFESPNICTKCYIPENQLVIGKDRAFTFDKVFDIGTQQEDIFDTCVKNLVLGCFVGYNATVLAYGQTGSGKTFTMGSGYTIGLNDKDLGIIPRVIKLIFEEVEKRKSKADIVIKCAFIEIYNEELHDLLDHQSGSNNNGGGIIDRFMPKKEIQIREEKNGSISLFGLREDKVTTYEELAACLDKGSNFRSTASTLMNNCSSRSHAIFTITIEQSVIEDLYKADGAPAAQNQPGGQGPAEGANEEYMVAKFHFVDLAGSERAKRTGATGNTLKEGISINKGLLALGNVIAALTEDGKNHVPYRDSKLTRILQDSLGGNSRTSMIACVSPAEFNFEETLNTLKYASRARNIKNAPKVNRDPNSAQVAQLRQQVFDLQRELQTCKKILVTNNIEFDPSQIGPLDPTFDPSSQGRRQSTQGERFTSQQMQRCEQEIKDLKLEKAIKDKKVVQLQNQVETLTDQNRQSQIDLFATAKERDIARFNLEQIVQALKKNNLLDSVLLDLNNGRSISEGGSLDQVLGNGAVGILEEYQVKVEELKHEAQEKHSQIKVLQRDYEQLLESSNRDVKSLESKEQEIERLKRSLNKSQKESVQLRRSGTVVSAQPPKPMNNLPPVPGFSTSTFQAAAAIRKSNEQRKSALSETGATLPQKKQAEIPKGEPGQWMSKELDINFQHFNEVFIENLSQSLSAMLIKKPTSDQAGLNLKEGDIGLETAVIGAPMITEEHESDDSEDDDEHMVDDEEPIVLPKDEKEQQQVIESNEDVKKEDQQLRANLEQQEQVIENLEDNLKGKETLLQTIKEQHKLLSSNLLDAMKNEYHKKIASFQQEMHALEQERSEQLRKADNATQKSKLEELYKKKLKDLEDKVGMAKSKEREQQAMLKQSGSQKQKIVSLEGEIEKIKSQKVSLMKRIKEESEVHRKWKAEKVKEIMQIKTSNVKKDREIQMLRRDNKKKDQIAKRKQEEITAMLKKTKSDKQKQVNGQKDRMKKKNIDMEYLQNWIVTNTEKMLRYKDLKQNLSYEIEQRNEVDNVISEEQNAHAQLSVRREKLEFRKSQIESELECVNDEELYHVSEEIGSLNLEMGAIQDNLDNLEEKHDFIEEKISSINTAIIEFSPEDIEQLKFEEVQSIEGARACLAAFFTILLDVNVYKRQLENQNSQNEATIESLNLQLEELRQLQHANEISFQKQIESINQEYMQKEELLIKLIMENGGGDFDQVHAQLIQGNVKVSTKDDLKAKKSAVTPGPIQSAKLEIQKNNQQMYVQSKTALSKRVAELERERKDDSKRFETLKHKLEQTNADKEVLKRQLDTIKTKIKQQEVMEVKQSKAFAQEESANNFNSLSGQKSPRITPVSFAAAQIQKMSTLRDARNERKTKKQQAGQSSSRQQDPRVIADEPMEEEEEDLQIVNKRPDGSRDSRIENGQVVPKMGDVFSRLLMTKSRPAQGSFVESLGQLSQSHSLLSPSDTPQYEDDLNWKCITNKESAHQGQICAIASVGNQLYSTSNKSLRIWDLENMQVVSDIQAHQGFIRCLIAWQERTLLVTASERSIILWDMVSLTQVITLKGHKEEIRALAVGSGSQGNLLFSGGKGTATGGGLLIWDLRKGTVPLEEKEKNQDVFSLALSQNHLFMGCRNHLVFPINLSNFETQHSFQPPHFDAVTSLAVMQDDTLISGSRDKNLRCWDNQTLSSLNPTSAIMSAHNDWINTLETDQEKKMMYSGCKDGIVKVWKQKNRQLRCSAQLSLQTGQAGVVANGNSSINTISKIDRQFGVMFATGSSDRQIRIWKYKDSNPYDDDQNDQEADGQPDFEMVDEHPSRQEMEDEMFEFEEPSNSSADLAAFNSSSNSQKSHHYKHANSQKVEEVKSEVVVQQVRTFSRASSQMMAGTAAAPQSSAATKLEMKRIEKRLQNQARRNYDGN